MEEKVLADYILSNKEQYEIFASRPMTVQRVSVVGNFCRNILGVASLCIPLPDGKESIWLEKKAHLRYQKIVDSWLKGNNFSKHLNNYNILGRKLIAISREAKKVKNNKISLLAFYNSWQKTLADFSIYFVSPFIVEDEVCPRFLKKPRNASLLPAISEPTRLFGYQKFQLDLLSGEDTIDYSKLLKKYSWLSEYSLKEKLWQEKDLKQKKKEIFKKGLLDNINNYQANVVKSRKAYRQAIKFLKGKDLLLAQIIHEYVNIRTERIEIYQEALVGVRDFYRQLTEVVKKEFPWFSYFEAINLSNQEIVAYLKDGVLPSKVCLLARKNRQAVYFLPAKKQGIHEIFIYKPSLVARIIKKYFSAENSQIIRGAVVSNGLTHGRVRLVLSPLDFKDFKKGEILVTHYTSPSFIPVIKKAAAIITDEGGVTSHAAIISRELKVPCVVGAKIATKALKNGDLVEVDANQGIVKIIKK